MKISNLVEKQLFLLSMIFISKKFSFMKISNLVEKKSIFRKKSAKIKCPDFFCDFSTKPQLVRAKQEQFVFLLLIRLVSGYSRFHKTLVDFI